MSKSNFYASPFRHDHGQLTPTLSCSSMTAAVPVFNSRLIQKQIRGDIQVATGCTVAVPLPRSSLARLPILPPELILPCLIPSLCYYCYYSWMSTGSPCSTKHPSNPPPLTAHPLSTHPSHPNDPYHLPPPPHLDVYASHYCFVD